MQNNRLIHVKTAGDVKRRSRFTVSRAARAHGPVCFGSELQGVCARASV